MGWGISVGTSSNLPDMCLCLPVTLPATIMTSSVPTTVGGHMMYPSPHAVMYAPTSGLADGSLTVLNAFSQAPSTMQVSHSQVQEQGELGSRAEERRTISSLARTHLNAPMQTQMYTLTHTYIYAWMLAHTLHHACPLGYSCTLEHSYSHAHLDTFGHSPLGTYI